MKKKVDLIFLSQIDSSWPFLLKLFSKKSLKSENHSGQIKPTIINVHLELVQKVYIGFKNDVTTDTNDPMRPGSNILSQSS